MELLQGIRPSEEAAWHTWRLSTRLELGHAGLSLPRRAHGQTYGMVTVGIIRMLCPNGAERLRHAGDGAFGRWAGSAQCWHVLQSWVMLWSWAGPVNFFLLFPILITCSNFKIQKGVLVYLQKFPNLAG
jgi:hypothetical protein